MEKIVKENPAGFPEEILGRIPQGISGVISGEMLIKKTREASIQQEFGDKLIKESFKNSLRDPGQNLRKKIFKSILGEIPGGPQEEFFREYRGKFLEEFWKEFLQTSSEEHLRESRKKS